MPRGSKLRPWRSKEHRRAPTVRATRDWSPVVDEDAGNVTLSLTDGEHGRKRGVPGISVTWTDLRRGSASRRSERCAQKLAMFEIRPIGG
jgi:hypothetical protein